MMLIITICKFLDKQKDNFALKIPCVIHCIYMSFSKYKNSIYTHMCRWLYYFIIGK